MQLINDTDKALGCCASLIVVDEELLTVHFAHSSVKQYLLSHPMELDLQHYHVVVSEAQCDLARFL